MAAASSSDADSRTSARHRFISGQLAGADFVEETASADAGFRSYWRITRADGGTAIVMDAPPELIECTSFLRVGALLRDHAIQVPEVLGVDLDQGFLLLSDLGRATCLDAVRAGADGDAIIDAAIDTLVQMQGIAAPDWLPPYDEALLARELDLFPEWYLRRHRQTTLSTEDAAAWREARTALIASSLGQARVFVHRDYMPRNLMPGSPAPGVLDFQDAVAGPIGYDAIALLKDAFWSWPPAQVREWLQLYHRRALRAALPVPAWPEFLRDAEWCGIQRHLKILGLFARLRHRDGKPKYLDDLPRFFAYLFEVLPAYPELAGLERLLRRHVFGTAPSA